MPLISLLIFLYVISLLESTITDHLLYLGNDFYFVNTLILCLYKIAILMEIYLISQAFSGKDMRHFKNMV